MPVELNFKTLRIGDVVLLPPANKYADFELLVIKEFIDGHNKVIPVAEYVYDISRDTDGYEYLDYDATLRAPDIRGTIVPYFGSDYLLADEDLRDMRFPRKTVRTGTVIKLDDIEVQTNRRIPPLLKPKIFELQQEARAKIK